MGSRERPLGLHVEELKLPFSEWKEWGCSSGGGGSRLLGARQDYVMDGHPGRLMSRTATQMGPAGVKGSLLELSV